MDTVRANREVYSLIRNGVRVKVRREYGSESPEVVRVIDWNDPSNNDYLLVSQFWIVGDMYKRRADLVGFVNGLPLVFIELKASHKKLEHAYDDNLTDYRMTIPQVFWANGFIILSNGTESRIGTVVVRLGALRRVEEDQRRGRAGDRLAGDDDPRHLRAGAAAGSGRELHGVLGAPWRPGEAGRQEPPVPRGEQRHRAARRGRARARGRSAAVSACSGTRRAPARRCRWCSSRRRCCGRCPATGRS